MTVRIELGEYESTIARLSPERAAALQVTAGTALGVSPAGAGSYRITASSQVGAIACEGLEVRVRPKVPVDNVLFLLTSSWRRGWFRPDVVGYDTSDLSAGFVALFAEAVSQLLRRGTLQEYVEVTDDLETIRGRIELTAQFRRPGRLLPVTCTFTELTTDTPVNRYMKHAIRIAMRVPGVWRETRRELRHALTNFELVADTPPRADLPLRLHFTRLNRSYEPVLRLAHLLRTQTATSDRSGDLSASAFLLDMNHVFERFVEATLRDCLAGSLMVDGQVHDYLDHQRRVPIRPDFVFRDRRGRAVYVGDAKYKLSSDGFGRASDYYQLLAYCTRLSLAEGVLLYGTEDPDVGSMPATVTAIGSDVRLRTLRVPLMGPPAEISASLDAIADDIRDRSHATSSGPVLATTSSP